MNPIIAIVIAGLTLVVGLAIGYFISRTQTEKAQRQQREKADRCRGGGA